MSTFGHLSDSCVCRGQDAAACTGSPQQIRQLPQRAVPPRALSVVRTIQPGALCSGSAAVSTLSLAGRHVASGATHDALSTSCTVTESGAGSCSQRHHRTADTGHGPCHATSVHDAACWSALVSPSQRGSYRSVAVGCRSCQHCDAWQTLTFGRRHLFGKRSKGSPSQRQWRVRWRGVRLPGPQLHVQVRAVLAIRSIWIGTHIRLGVWSPFEVCGWSYG